MFESFQVSRIEPCQGFLMWLHLSSCGVYITFWGDMFHKVARKTSLALSIPDHGAQFMRKVNRLFRMLRGPWGSGKFGKIHAEARQHLIKLLATSLHGIQHVSSLWNQGNNEQYLFLPKQISKAVIFLCGVLET